MRELEYLILSCCADTLFPVHLVPRDPAVRFPISEVVEVLCRLFEQGDLFALPSEGPCNPEIDGVENIAGLEPLPLSASEIDAAVRTRGPSLAMGLTACGTARWERAAQPNWDLYISSGTQFDAAQGNWEVQMWSRTRARLEEAIRFHYWSGEVIPGTLKWSTVSPWHATYWKALSEGIHAEYRRHPNHSGVETDAEKEWSQTLSWYRSPTEFR
ncbi:MAG TPA: hypothetical protein VN893_26325 [Bryobacteraceae bacterium]|nr:hypothetical protein [Bryobacteraceae bacterium]